MNRLQDRLSELEQATEGHGQREIKLKSQLEQAQLQIDQLSPAAAETEQLNGERKLLLDKLAGKYILKKRSLPTFKI